MWTSILLLTVLVSVQGARYYGGVPFNQCPRSPPRFSFPVSIGNITSDTDISPAGLVHSRRFSNVLYFISDNDSTKVYAISALTGQIIGSTTITDAVNMDWEDITLGLCPTGMSGYCIYVQDAGAGAGPPDVVANVIYVIKEPLHPGKHVSKAADMIITYTVQDGTTLEASNGLFVDCQGNIFFFDEISEGLGATFFQLVPTNGNYVATPLFQLDLPTSSSGPRALSLSADCCELLVKTEDKVYHIPVKNGLLKAKSLSVLPYMPASDEEEAIAWSPRGDKYYIVSESAPITLKVAFRDKNVPDPKFGLGKSLGMIGTDLGDLISGLAASRRFPGFVYASTPDSLLLVQAFEAQDVGRLLLTFNTVPVTSFSDIATGRCPSTFTETMCVYLSHLVINGPDLSQRVLVFPEPDNLFVDTTLALDDTNLVIEVPIVAIEDTPFSIFVGKNGEVYLLGITAPGATYSVFEVVTQSGTATLQTIANMTNPSPNSGGPRAADFSPCFNEIVVKFDEIVVLLEAPHGNVAEAFSGKPSFLPYITERNGNSVTFLDCHTYLTTSEETQPVALLSYHRDRSFSSYSSLYDF